MNSTREKRDTGPDTCLAHHPFLRFRLRICWSSGLCDVDAGDMVDACGGMEGRGAESAAEDVVLSVHGVSAW